MFPTVGSPIPPSHQQKMAICMPLQHASSSPALTRTNNFSQTSDWHGLHTPLRKAGSVICHCRTSYLASLSSSSLQDSKTLSPAPHATAAMPAVLLRCLSGLVCTYLC
mmetsp:Transcript_54470/g.116362  ORF Transcript_54470/g.116362 Transcript_54470/m.116362 type:complete len:108 (+) Transcript_54470:202-525(+)